MRAVAAALTFLASAALAQPAPQRMLDDAEARAYAAVGRLNVAGDRHCTATLISDRLVLTAAHCLFNGRTGRRSEVGSMKFVAGQRRDEYAALRGVVAAAPLPDYAPSIGGRSDLMGVALDLALVELDEPIPPEVVAPLRVGPLAAGEPQWIVAYGRDRAYAASIREGCAVIEDLEIVAVLDCAVTFGVSGAPVLAAGPDGPLVTAVVSAMSADGAGRELAFVVSAAPAMDELAAALADAAGGLAGR